MTKAKPDADRHPSFREFVATVNTADHTRHAGIGMTPDDVIDYWREEYREHHRRGYVAARGAGGKPTPEEHAASWDDVTVWEGARVLAVLAAPFDGGEELQVVRFDGPRRLPLKRPLSSPAVIRHPTEPGKESEPLVSFRVVAETGELDEIHDGRGLGLEGVVAEATQYWEPFQQTPTSDLTVYRDGMVQAVIRNFGNGRLRPRVMPIGEQWVFHVDDDGWNAGHRDEGAPPPPRKPRARTRTKNKGRTGGGRKGGGD